MLYEGDCWSCAHQDNGEACNCRQSKFYRFACMFIKPPRCECYGRRAEPGRLPPIAGGLREVGREAR